MFFVAQNSDVSLAYRNLNLNTPELVQMCGTILVFKHMSLILTCKNPSKVGYISLRIAIQYVRRDDSFLGHNQERWRKSARPFLRYWKSKIISI